MSPKGFNNEKYEVLNNLIEYDIWDERLLSDVLFGKTVETVLSPRERFVLEEKVKGTDEKRISQLLHGSSPQNSFDFYSLSSMKSKIKQKLRDGRNAEIPGWIRGGNKNGRSWER